MANISSIKVGDTSYGITATPTTHASATTIYGKGDTSNYGHVKLSDSYKTSGGAAASGIGASSAAVYNTYNTLNSKFVFETKTYTSKQGGVIKIVGVQNNSMYHPKAPVTFIYGYSGYYCGKVEIFGWHSGALTYGVASGPTVSSSSSANIIATRAVIGTASSLSFGASGAVWNFTPTLSGNTLILTQTSSYAAQSMFITAPSGSLTIS